MAPPRFPQKDQSKLSIWLTPNQNLAQIENKAA